MYNYSFVMPHRFHAWSMLVLVSIFVSFARFMIQIIYCYLHHFMSICWKWLTRIMYAWLYYFKSTWIMLTFVLIKSLNWQLWLHYALLCQGKVISGFLLRINTIPTIKMKSSIYEYINIRKFVFFFFKKSLILCSVNLLDMKKQSPDQVYFKVNIRTHLLHLQINEICSV